MGRLFTAFRKYSIPDLDEPSNVPADLKTLATAIDTDMRDVKAAIPFAWAFGVEPVQSNGSSWYQVSYGVKFPAGRFTVPPVVLVSISTGNGGTLNVFAHTEGISKDTFDIILATPNNTTKLPGTTIPVYWCAFQGYQSSAVG